MSAAGSVAVQKEAVTAAPLERTGMEEAAFRDLYNRTARPLWGYLARATGNDSVADDLLQETFFRMVRSSFRPESDDHARNFLFKVATNLVRDYYRSPKRGTLPLEHSPAVEGPEHDVRLRQDVRRIFAQLKPRERELLWLGHVEQFSHKEIAGILGLKPGSIRLLLFRARRKLASLMEEAGLGPESLR
jgi:RNA polymerase sigma-70 factor (ECF subfamily)